MPVHRYESAVPWRGVPLRGAMRVAAGVWEHVPLQRRSPAVVDDGRLDRTLETAAMFMEALQGFEHKVVYTMVGHSGDGAAIDLGASDYARPPQNDKERFKILQASPGR